MPPLPSVGIPVIVRPNFKGKQAVRAPKPRIYSDDPLPVTPSNHAPKSAKIIGREMKISGVSYHLKIGDVEINDVSVQEILEYVSALELEQYEHEQFKEERIALEAAEAAEEERKREKLERMKQRAKTKGIVTFESDPETNDDMDGGEEIVGRHGRARPTYTHLFKKINIRKGNAIEPGFDVMLTATDEDEEMSEDGPMTRGPIVRGQVSFSELPKRRRRKRDKVTGELLPLTPKAQAIQSAQAANYALSEQKRRRRRRHPLTGELMPVGWRYDPDKQSDTYESRRSGQALSARRLSSSQENEAKRPRLDTGNELSRSSSPLPAKASPIKEASLTMPRGASRQPRPHSKLAAAVELLSSEDERDVVSPAKVTLRSPPKPIQSRPTISALMQCAALSSAAETSPEPSLRPFLPSPKVTKITSPQSFAQPLSPKRTKTPKTSILRPSAGRASSTEPPAQLSHDDEDEESDEEYFIEGVLAHSWSDPRTHPTSLGNKPVTLYQVKWEGYKEPTWYTFSHFGQCRVPANIFSREPGDSFTDRSVLDDYRQRVGLPFEASVEEMESEREQEAAIAAPQRNTQNLINPDPADESEMLGEDEYEVEGIVGHQLSDPRTHPPELGHKPVMLYYVKWKGYDELTWEPVASFEDISMVRAYNREFDIEDSTIESDEMEGVT